MMGKQHVLNLRLFSEAAYWGSLIGVLLLLYHFGFGPPLEVRSALMFFYWAVVLLGTVSGVYRYVQRFRGLRWTVLVSDGIYLCFLLLALGAYVVWEEGGLWYSNSALVVAGLCFVLAREFSEREELVYLKHLNPAQLFIISFALIIVLGTGLLLLPKATYTAIAPLDALFTSASAVCVTGLIVVDTGSFFTPFGQAIIVGLIQVGGIGIMTITSYFSYFFKGGATYGNQLLLKSMANAEKIADVFKRLKQILLLTFVVEGLGVIFIYWSVGSDAFGSTADRLFFALFHSVSGFCNAGFSTLEQSLYELPFRFNYPLQLIIAALFIIGGLGFPIAFNFMTYMRYLVRRGLSFRSPYDSRPWVLNINSRIILVTSAVLLVVGTLLFYRFEYHNTLEEHTGFGKWAVAFFGAATPRTAGFNSVDTSALHLHTLMIVFLLMWIGASPGSTGGGIKTSTFAVSVLNLLSMARGKERVEIFRREIAPQSLKRAFAVISLSLVAIGAAVFLIASFEPDKELLAIAFESFSAYSTVGLSLGITADLSSPSKVVLVLLMFAGRVGLLTVLSAVLQNAPNTPYRYPSEEVLIT